MPTILNPVLKLTRQEDGTVDIDFSYRAQFLFQEMQMTKLGVIFVERVDFFGVDPPGGTTGTLIPLDPNSFPLNQILDVPSGDEYFPKPVAIIINRPFIVTGVSRGYLDEDPSPANVSPDWTPDEFRCRVEIKSLMPTAVGFSNQEVLELELHPGVLDNLENVQVINNEVKTVEFKLSH